MVDFDFGKITSCRSTSVVTKLQLWDIGAHSIRGMTATAGETM